MKTIDARGLSCPEPVIRTKNALASGEKAYTVMVDNVTAKENVSRFALHQGYKVSVKKRMGKTLSSLLRNNGRLHSHIFFPHFGAMSFKKKCEKEGYPATIMPVPKEFKLFLRNLREIHRGSTDCAKLELR